MGSAKNKGKSNSKGKAKVKVSKVKVEEQKPSRPRPWSCPFCPPGSGPSYTNKGNLTSHVQSKHPESAGAAYERHVEETRKVLYSCPFCPHKEEGDQASSNNNNSADGSDLKWFKSGKKLRAHMVRHMLKKKRVVAEGEGPRRVFACAFCSDLFLDEATVSVHAVDVHPELLANQVPPRPEPASLSAGQLTQLNDVGVMVSQPQPTCTVHWVGSRPFIYSIVDRPAAPASTPATALPRAPVLLYTRKGIGENSTLSEFYEKKKVKALTPVPVQIGDESLLLNAPTPGKDNVLFDLDMQESVSGEGNVTEVKGSIEEDKDSQAVGFGYPEQPGLGSEVATAEMKQQQQQPFPMDRGQDNVCTTIVPTMAVPVPFGIGGDFMNMNWGPGFDYLESQPQQYFGPFSSFFFGNSQDQIDAPVQFDCVVQVLNSTAADPDPLLASMPDKEMDALMMVDLQDAALFQAEREARDAELRDKVRRILKNLELEDDEPEAEVNEASRLETSNMNWEKCEVCGEEVLGSEKQKHFENHHPALHLQSYKYPPNCGDSTEAMNGAGLPMTKPGQRKEAAKTKQKEAKKSVRFSPYVTCAPSGSGVSETGKRAPPTPTPMTPGGRKSCIQKK